MVIFYKLKKAKLEHLKSTANSVFKTMQVDNKTLEKT